MISPFVAVLRVADGARILVNLMHVETVLPSTSQNGRECIVIWLRTGSMIVYGTVDGWERATGTPASV